MLFLFQILFVVLSVQNIDRDLNTYLLCCAEKYVPEGVFYNYCVVYTAYNG